MFFIQGLEYIFFKNKKRVRTFADAYMVYFGRFALIDCRNFSIQLGAKKTRNWVPNATKRRKNKCINKEIKSWIINYISCSCYLFAFSAVSENTTTPNSCCKQETNPQNKPKEDITTKEKKKRFRSHFSQLQLQYLESIFARQHYLSRDERTLLANALDMTELQVRNWFQNKRYQKRHREIQALQKVGKQVPVKILVAERSHVVPTLGVRHEEMRYWRKCP